MTHKKYLAVCIAAASMGITSLQVVAEETVQNDKVTVVGQESKGLAQPLEVEAQVSKVGAPIEELPYSVAVIDQDFIQSTGAKNIQDALLYTSGVNAGNFGIDTRIDSAMVRGADPLKYLDGLRSHYSHYNNVRPSIFALEQVEVLKGPSSVLYGQSTVGGLVNAVSKRPKEEQQGEFWAQVGSFDRKQLAADWTGAVDDEGKVLVRFVGLARDSGTQVDYADDDELLFMPSVTWRITDKTQITAIANYQKREGAVNAMFLPQQGTLDAHPLGFIDPSRFVGEPDWDKYDREQKALTLEFEHAFNESWRLKSVARYVDANTETREIFTAAPWGATANASGDIVRRATMSDRSTEGFSIDTRVNGNFKIADTEHKLTLGIDHQDITTDEWNKYSQFTSSINLFNPVYGSLPVIDPSDITDPDAVTTKQLGVYVADHIKIGNNIISTALRHDRADTNGSVKSALSKHLGYMYQFDSGISPYVSYSESFEPNTDSDGAGGILEPTEGEQMEYGVKYLSPDSSTSVTLAYFEIEETGRVSSGSTPGGLAQSNAEIDGWELEARKNWDRFSVLFNYSDLNTKDENGPRIPYLSERQASLWSHYQFPSNWKAGFGVRYTGDTVGWGGTGPAVPGVTLLDAMVGYETGDWEFTADVKNLTNKTYVAWCRSAGTDCGYGEKLNATLNARYKF
ncbi:TonB-dependent siderophore receptor [Neptuniibacter caesariensis]|uniref:Outer membrane protein n=1 Tax=Neptuniibacter caesariensis TaxID=207954 RepID=A0A7U8GSY1_NEPCE|nr:TonB-dependent siderophore receptor [Neptuniibacter caesariensis]EAR61856.1 Outer membrane protein [Oceanospirillum sp. MED92] [Neptuniibacter caesariensis]